MEISASGRILHFEVKVEDGAHAVVAGRAVRTLVEARRPEAAS
jgi:hypothetical protein